MTPRKRKLDSLTNGQVAKILKVSARTVSKWADLGKIKHWKVNKDRRFNIDDVIIFAKSMGMQCVIEKENDSFSESLEVSNSVIAHLNKKISKLESACISAKNCLSESKFSISENCFKIEAEKKKKVSILIEEVLNG